MLQENILHTNDDVIHYEKQNLSFIVNYELDRIASKVAKCKEFLTRGQNKFPQCYFYIIGLWALLSQPISAEQCLKEMSRRIYPWLAFELVVKKKTYLLTFNFVEHNYTEYIHADNSQKTMHFAQLEKVTYGFQCDEVIVTRNNQSIVYIARYSDQRTFIAEVFRYAISRDLEIKVKSHYINPNDDNFKGRLQEQENVFIVFKQNLRLAQQGYFKLIKNDRLLPCCDLITCKVYLSEQSHQLFLISLGSNNVVVHQYGNFIQMIPYMHDSFHVEWMAPKCLGLHVGKILNYFYFESQLDLEKFRNLIMQRRKGQLPMEPVYLHFNDGDEENEGRLIKYKKIKLSQLEQQIQEQEQVLQRMKKIKNDLEIGVMSAELNSVVRRYLFVNQIKSKPRLQKSMFDFSKVDSPSFQQFDQQQYY